MDPAMLALMGVEINYALAVTLPGSITAHNGRSNQEAPFRGGSICSTLREEVFFVQSSRETQVVSTVVIIIIALVLLAGVSIFLLRRKANAAETQKLRLRMLRPLK